MPYGGGDLYVKVEIYINGAFVEVTTRARGGRAASGVEINRGRGTGAIQAEASTCSLTLGNDDGYVTEDNPESPWYPYVGRGTRVRVSIASVAASDAVRFDGEIDTIVAVYPGGSDSSVRITATGTLGGQLGLGSDPLSSPLFRSMSGIAPGGYAPHEYWSLEDGASSTLFASALPGGSPMAVVAGVTPSADSSLPGSLPLPQLTEDANVSAGAPVRTYTDQGQWVVQQMVRIPDDGGPDTNTVLTVTTSTNVAKYVQVGFGTDNLILQVYANDGSDSGGFTQPYDTARVHDQWVSIVLASINNASGTTDRMWVGMYDTAGDLIASIDELVGVGYHSNVRRIDLNGVSYVGLGRGEAYYGHVGLYIDAAWSVGTDDVFNARAAGGWVGELAHDRIQRLCDEEGLLVTVTGTSVQAMGAQSLATLLDLLIECEAVDQGLLSDGADDGLTYRCLSSMYNQTAALAVTNGSLDGDVAPMWDNRNVRNDITVSRDGGSSSRQTDEAHITRTRRRIKDSATVNVETDAQLPDQAGWRLNQGVAPGPRYNGVGINLRNASGRALADAVLTLQPGDRFTVAEAALPDQHPPGGIDSLVVGWREDLDKDKWLFAPNCVPYSPFVVAELDDDDSAKLDTDGSDLTAAVTSTGTTLSVATQTGTSPLWTTDSGEMPIPLTIGGEVMSATAVAAPTTITYGAVGTATHASNASVTPGIPASVAAGNLLIVLAAIRNSGTGVPDTPSGYTRLPVFDDSDNVQLFAKVAAGGDSAPTITFTGGVANATTSAQMIRIAGAFSDPAECFVRGQALLNSSAQDITYPGLPLEEPVMATAIHNAIVIWVGWKQDDWTSVATISGATEIAEASTVTGDDQALVWDYQIQTTATDIVQGSFTVTGGAAAISRGAVFAVRSNIQAFTVTRSVNGVVKSHSAGAPVNVHKPFRFAL